MNKTLVGDNRVTLKALESKSVHCGVTSPPYWQLRDYGVDGQIGLEKTPQEYIGELLKVFSEVHRVLRDDGTLWVNMGDSYAATAKNRSVEQSTANHGLSGSTTTQEQCLVQASKIVGGLKPKDLCGMPWRLAFALQDAGWYLRQDIIWKKPAPMPSSVKDRCTTAHEYVFLLTKKPTYYWDWYAISEKCEGDPAKESKKPYQPKTALNGAGSRNNESFTEATHGLVDRRNKRSVWTVNTKGYSGAHFACFPPKLIEPMILAGSPDKCCRSCGKGYQRQVESVQRQTRPGERSKIKAPNGWDTSTGKGAHGSFHKDGRRSTEETGNRDPERHVTEYVDKGFFKSCDCDTYETKPAIVLDPFGGSGTTAQVAQDNGRNWIMCELNPEYIPMIDKRTEQPQLF